MDLVIVGAILYKYTTFVGDEKRLGDPKKLAKELYRVYIQL